MKLSLVDYICWGFALGIIALCGYALYKYFNETYTKNIEKFQAVHNYINFANNTINNKKYITPYAVINDKPYLLCTLIDNINYKNNAIADFNSININYVFDFGIANVSNYDSLLSKPIMYAFTLENTSYNNIINNYQSTASNAFGIKETFYPNDYGAVPKPYYISLSYGFTLGEFALSTRKSFISTYQSETQVYYDKGNILAPWLLKLNSNTITNFPISILYQNNKNKTSYLLFKNTYVTDIVPNTKYWDDSGTGGYDHSIWYDTTKGYVYTNISNTNNYSKLTANTQKWYPQLFKNYSVNDNFKKYMSLEFSIDFPENDKFTTDGNLYTLKISDSGPYLKIYTDDVTYPITTTTNISEAAVCSIYTITIGQETVTKYIFPASENNLSGTYIMGFDYVNCGTYTQLDTVPYLRLYKAINTAISSYWPEEFTLGKINYLNDLDKLHNYKLPWFEFKLNGTTSCLRGSGLFTNYLVYAQKYTGYSVTETPSIVLSSDKSYNSVENISRFVSELKFKEPVFNATLIRKVFRFSSSNIIIYLQPDTTNTYYRIYNYDTNKPIDISVDIATRTVNYTDILTTNVIPYYKLADDPSVNDYIQIINKYNKQLEYIPLNNIYSDEIFINKVEPINIGYELDKNKYLIKINVNGTNKYLTNSNTLTDNILLAAIFIRHNIGMLPNYIFESYNKPQNYIMLDYDGNISIVELLNVTGSDIDTTNINKTNFFIDKYYSYENNILLTYDIDIKKFKFTDVIGKPANTIYSNTFNNITISSIEFSMVVPTTTAAVTTTTTATTTAATTTTATTTAATTTAATTTAATTTAATTTAATTTAATTTAATTTAATTTTVPEQTNIYAITPVTTKYYQSDTMPPILPKATVSLLHL